MNVSPNSSNSNARSTRLFLLVLEVLVLSLSIDPCTAPVTDMCLSLLPLKQEVSLVENLSWKKYLSTSHGRSIFIPLIEEVSHLSAFSIHVPSTAMQLDNTRCYRYQCYQVKRLKICCHMSMSLIVQDICMCWFQ